MTINTPSQALRHLRDTLRTTQPDIETLINLLSTCLNELYNDAGPSTSSLEPARKALQRFLPSIQIHILTNTVPNYLHTLDDSQVEVLRSFFVPQREAAGIRISRWIALTSYLTLPPFMNAPSTTASIPDLPISSRTFLLEILDRLSRDYGIDEMYWAVWSGVEEREKGRLGPEELIWEEVTRSLGGVPAKAANAVGRWKSDDWIGDIQESLVPRTYFDSLIVKVENLMYELSMSPTPGVAERIRLVLERLTTLGMLKTPPNQQHSRQPSFLYPLLPPLLAHLHPPTSSPLAAYPATFLPTIFLPLPASTLSAFVSSLLQHLSFRISVLKLGMPNEDVHRAVEILRMIIGKAEVGGEAWVAILRAVCAQRTLVDSINVQEHVIARIVYGWIRSGGQAERREFVQVIPRLWTDPKSIKFALYSQQYRTSAYMSKLTPDLTHLLLLSLSLFPAYDPYLTSLSHRAEFLIAIQSFLSHPDPKVRRLGMLVAEILSELTIRESDDNNAQTEEKEMAELQAGFETSESEKKPRTSRGPRRLKFGEGMWGGEGEGKEECRRLRECVGVNDLDLPLTEDPTGKKWLLGWDQIHVAEPASDPRPAINRGRQPETKSRSAKEPRAKPKPKPKIVMLDPDQEADPLEGYAPQSPSSSRSPSPTPSFLEEVAADPTLALDSAQNKKASRPVYVQQLIMLLKEREKPEYIEMGLKWGEGLVRAKRSFGTELSENAVNLATVTIGLNNPYNLEDFDDTRKGLMNALVASAPRQVAPFLIEQYFEGQYSLQQKSVLLTAIAMGARELSGLSTPQPMNSHRRLDFPTKMLPPALHQKYIGPNDVPENQYQNQLEQAVSGVRDMMLRKSAKRAEEYPELAREKKLRVGPGKSTKVAEVGSRADREMTATPTAQAPIMPFKDVAAEYFIMPLINRFWQYFQDSSTREARAINTGDRYRGAGTGMILSAMALEKMLMTLSLLIHAARHSSVFLSVLAPEAIELGVTIGARHLATPSNNPLITDLDTKGVEEGSRTEAQVLAAALELVLVSLDVSVELDKGRTLALDKAELVLAAGEWATGVFEVESKGGKVSAGQGGMREGKVKATAAGVVVKISEIGERWAAVGSRMR